MLHIFKYLFFILIFFIFTNAKSIETDWTPGVESQIRLISPVTSNNNQKEIAQKVFKEVNLKLSGKVATKVSLLKNYCPAEEHHQKYLEKR